MAVGQKTGGRTKGTPNRASAAREAEIAATGMTPLDFLTSVYRDLGEEMSRRVDAAKAAAQYVHSKLSTVDAKIEGKLDVTEVAHRVIDDAAN